jgi:hypothetical protein
MRIIDYKRSTSTRSPKVCLIKIDGFISNHLVSAKEFKPQVLEEQLEERSSGKESNTFNSNKGLSTEKISPKRLSQEVQVAEGEKLKEISVKID